MLLETSALCSRVLSRGPLPGHSSLHPIQETPLPEASSARTPCYPRVALLNFRSHGASGATGSALPRQHISGAAPSLALLPAHPQRCPAPCSLQAQLGGRSFSKKGLHCQPLNKAASQRRIKRTRTSRRARPTPHGHKACSTGRDVWRASRGDTGLACFCLRNSSRGRGVGSDTFPLTSHFCWA